MSGVDAVVEVSVSAEDLVLLEARIFPDPNPSAQNAIFSEENCSLMSIILTLQEIVHVLELQLTWFLLRRRILLQMMMFEKTLIILVSISLFVQFQNLTILTR